VAENEGCRVTVEAFVVCTSPDVCWTQVGDKKVLIPYQIYAKFTDVVGDVPTVRFAGENSINMETRITTVYGDEEGIHGGEVSGVNKGWCRPITHSTTIRVNGSFLIYHTSTYWMNCNGPDGPGNTKGEVQFFTDGTTPFGGPLVDLEKMREDAEKSWWEKASPWVHGALDIIGLIPGAGEIADGINAVIYLAEGDYANAALSGAAMIPFAGWGATAAKAVKHADNAIDAAKTVDKANDARRIADDVPPPPKPKDGDVPPTNKPKDGEGTSPGDGATVRPQSCFIGSTLVHTPAGTRAIADLHTGALVLGFDFSHHHWVPAIIEELHSHHANEIYELILSDETNLQCTAEHPFWIEKTGWVPACKLRIGDKLLSRLTEQISVQEISVQNFDSLVFNLKVAAVGTYAVATSGILVHNKAAARIVPGNGYKKPSDKWLKDNGVDPHKVKDEYGLDAKFDIYKDNNGNLFFMRKPNHGGTMDNAEHFGHISDFGGG
jgi:hypothetical protein